MAAIERSNSTAKIDGFEQDERRSVQSQISFQDELTATLRSRKTTVKNTILNTGFYSTFN